MYYKSKEVEIHHLSPSQLTEILDFETLTLIRKSKVESKKLFSYNLEFFMILSFITLTILIISSNIGEKKCLNYSQNSMINRN